MYIQVADNSGVKTLMCIQNLSKSKKSLKIGDIFVGVVKNTKQNSPIKKSKVVRALIIRSKIPYTRKDGTILKFKEPAAIIINADKSPVGSRIFGPVITEIRDRGFSKIAAVAEVLI